MGSRDNPLVQCHIIRDLLRRIEQIQGEFLDHENTLPKCEICWESRNEFTSLKSQLHTIVQDNNFCNERKSLKHNESDGDSDVDPFTMVVVKEEQKTDTTDDDNVLKSDTDDRDNDWNPWERSKKKRLQCPTCSKTYFAGKRLINHMALCKSGPSTKPPNLLVDENLATSDTSRKTFECNFCGQIFKQKSQIITHMQLHDKSNQGTKGFAKSEDRTCKICEKKLHTLSGLKRHIKFHEKKKNVEKSQKSGNQDVQYPCDICKKTFRYAGALDRHKEFRDSAHLVCDMCNEKFCTNSDLMTHQRIVHKINSSFKCRYCEEQFNNFRLIIKHHKVKHPTAVAPESPFLCEMCGAVMMDQRDLNYHMRRLHESKRFKCTMCRRTFRLQAELDEHQRIHIPISQLKDLYECDVCPKKFRIKSSLLKHKKIHTGQTVEMFCTVCRKRFINANSLEVHMAKHANEGPRFKCDCGKTFTKLKYLNQHRKDDHNIFTHLMLNPKSKKKS